MANKEIIETLPEEVVNSKDINLIKEIRDWASNRVDNLRVEKRQAELDKYRPDIEGKIVFKYGKIYNKPFSEINPNDLFIIKVNKIDFVGHGFIRCDVVICNIKYGDRRESLDLGLFTADDYGSVSVSTYANNQYDFSFSELNELTILTEEQAKDMLNNGISAVTNLIDKFKKVVV